MAPKQKKQKQARKQGFKSTRGLRPEVRKYLTLINDPCNADYDLDAGYAGEEGTITRFVSDGTINTTAGHTSGFVLYHPGSGAVTAVSGADPATTTVVTLATYALAGPIPAPGLAFLVGTSAKQRAYAACITAFAAAVAPVNMTGEIAVGNLSIGTTLTTLSPNLLFSMLQHKSALGKQVVDVKWFPGTMDDRYLPWNDNTQLDVSDSNVICIAYRGYPAAAALSVRLTSVLEWTAKSGTGLNVSNTTRPTLPHNNAVAHLHKRVPRWLTSIGDAAGGAVRAFGVSFFDNARSRAPKLAANMSDKGFDELGSLF